MRWKRGVDVCIEMIATYVNRGISGVEVVVMTDSEAVHCTGGDEGEDEKEKKRAHASRVRRGLKVKSKMIPFCT